MCKTASSMCFLLSAYLFFVAYSLSHQPQGNPVYPMGSFSQNAMCKSFNFDQGGKNLCLLNLGFKNAIRTPIRIAVIDTGIDKNHSFLRPYISDKGYDLAHYSNPFEDSSGHGTHVAGIIVQQIEYLSDVTQTIIPFEIISVKYTDGGQASTLAWAISHVVRNEKIDILNISSYGEQMDVNEMMALKEAQDKKIQVVTASGNYSRNLDKFLQLGFPCSYKMDNIICVGNLTQFGFVNSSSNFGATVDIATVGTDVYSTLPGEQWGYMSGSSMATPRITALIAYSKAVNHKKDFYKKDEIHDKFNDPMFVLRGQFKSGILDFKQVVTHLPTDDN